MSGPLEVSSAQQFQELALKHQRLVVFFWATWSEPCDALNDVVEDICEAQKPALQVVKVIRQAARIQVPLAAPLLQIPKPRMRISREIRRCDVLACNENVVCVAVLHQASSDAEQAALPVAAAVALQQLRDYDSSALPG